MIPSLVMIWTSGWSDFVEGLGVERGESTSELEVGAEGVGDVDARAASNSDSCILCGSAGMGLDRGTG